MNGRPVEILLVEDNPGDVRLTIEAMRDSTLDHRLSVARDGVEALAFLRREGGVRPDLILLDLNLPRKDGRTVLKELKSDSLFYKVPIVVFTTSQASSDITSSYALGANCYLRKPGNLEEYRAVVQSMADFWLGFAALPQ